MARFLSAIQKEVAGLGSKINEDMAVKFAQQEAALLHKAKQAKPFSISR
jgi:hypothetical protein